MKLSFFAKRTEAGTGSALVRLSCLLPSWYTGVTI